MKQRTLFLSLAATATLALLVVACQPVATTNTNTNANTAQTVTAAVSYTYPADLKPALDTINTDDLMRHIKTLSSDEYEGRGPGTKGEELSVAYITDQFKRIGLKPGNPDGTYVQKVPLVGFTAQNPTASFTVGAKKIDLKFPDEWVGVSRRLEPEAKVENSDVVFVGYGVEAEEYGWNDFKGVDVKGKTILMLVNDPAVPDASDPSKLDDKMFKGKAMTYYGRWTYKYEQAMRHGAAAAIIIHETGPAGYPYEVVSGSWGRENFDIKTPENARRAAIEGWITLDRAKELLSAAGQDFDALKKQAISKDFKPVALNAKANFDIKNTLREINSQNVVAKLEGSDPKLKDEYVVYTAHWDHLGKDDKLQGDQIYNGADDNASGVAQLIEIAEAYTKLPTPPKRSILFVSVTAEEKGLLGSKYYASNPLYPLNKTLADINMDEANQWGRTRDLTIVGLGNTTLDDVAQEAATIQGGRTLQPDPQPEKGGFYRSDHFEFAKQGVPALNVEAGVDFPGKPSGWGVQKRDDYTEHDYHKPSDEIKPDWDLSGAVEDAQLYLIVGYRVAQGDKFPEWKEGTEFKAKRDASMKGGGGGDYR
ncbi:MAG: M28 family metallopeptidase [Pyrinomonadaceae bacterium]